MRRIALSLPSPAPKVPWAERMNSDSERLEVGALSETGYTRSENQDRMSGSQVPLGHLYIVADGMGGHEGGAIAAELAVQELQRQISQAEPNAPVEQVIENAFRRANDVVYAKGHSGDPATEGMGTTAVLLLVSGPNAKVAHVGDSRAYLCRSKTLSRLTSDHTIVQKMVEAEMLKAEDAASHPDASVLERAIGSRPTVEVDIRSHKLQDGDAILLCSDGLSGYVADDRIEAVLREHEGTVQEATNKLVQLALDGGGHDNVTVQLIRCGARGAVESERQTAQTKTPPNTVESAGSGPAQHARAPKQMPRALMIAGVAVAGCVVGGTGAGFAVVHYRNAMDAAIASGSKEVEGGLGKDLERSIAAREDAAKEATAAKRQLADATLASKATVDKLQAELESVRSAKQRADKDAANANRELGVAKAEQQRLYKELQGAKAANEAAQKRVRELDQELKAAKDAAPRPAGKPNQGVTAPESPSGVQETTKESGGAGAPAGEKDTGAPKEK